MSGKINRRDFLKTTTVTGSGLALETFGGAAGLTNSPSLRAGVKTDPLDKVRMGFVGVGAQGSRHVKNFLRIEGVEIKAVCDIVESKVARIQNWVEEVGQPKPVGYSRGEDDFKRMCDRENLDLVFTATPWRWHVPVCVAAMEAGKHAATEVPAAITIDGCWQLVETSEKTNKHCVMMENCCYDRAEMQILNMVRKGLFGEVLHGEAGYLHDLRRSKMSNRDGRRHWRAEHSIKRNGNLYPTHGLGPVAQCMNINRGDQFDYLVSMSTPSRGLNLYAAERFGGDDPRATQKYALGDVNSSLIQTKIGRTIILKHDCNLPRPYSRAVVLQGTKGIVRKYPEEKIHLEGRSPRHRWEPLINYREEYEHPLWVKRGREAQGAGHGGMDYLEDLRLIQCLITGEPMDMDVYDAAAWSAVSELSERSVAKRSKAMDFPDFTRGKWKTRLPLGIIAG